MATRKPAKANSTDKPIIKVTRIEDGWINGMVTYKKMNSKFYAKTFIEKSHFGINNGCISKLSIVFNPTNSLIVNYDRGWDIKPKSEYAKKVYRAVLHEFNNSMPEQYVDRWLKSLN